MHNNLCECSGCEAPSFNENVSLILHYNQAFLDLQDDWEDIVDDVQEDMPNVFVMAAVKDTPYKRIKNSSYESIRNMVQNNHTHQGHPLLDY